MGKIMIEGYECLRCGHRWIKRQTTEGDPIICPGCKSAYWNRPRTGRGRTLGGATVGRIKINEEEMNSRFCSNCGSHETGILQQRRKSDGMLYEARPHWFKDGKGGHWCKKCRLKLVESNKNRKEEEEGDEGEKREELLLEEK